MDIQGKAIISSDTSKAQKEIERLSKQSEELKKKMVEAQQANDKLNYDKYQKELRTTQSELRRVTREQEQLSKAVLDLKTAPLKDLEAESRRLATALRGMKRGTEEYTQTAKRFAIVNQEIKNTKQALSGVEGFFGRLNGTISNTVDKWGTSFTLATTAAVGFLYAVKQGADAAIKFESSFAKTRGLLADKSQTPEQQAQITAPLEQGAIDLIRQYGLQIEDVNNALYQTISAGIEAKDAVEFLNTAAQLSASGFSTLETAVDGISNTLNAYGLKTDQASVIADKFFKAQVLGKTTVTELARELGEIAPLAYNTGISIDDLLASVSAITVNGIRTNEAITMLKAAIQSIVKPTNEAIPILQKFNIPISATQLQALGLGETLKRLSAAFATNADEVTRAIPSMEGYMAIASLTGEKLQVYDKFVNQITSDIGKQSSMQLALQIQAATTDAQIKKSLGNITANSIELGKSLAPVIKVFFSALSNFSNLFLKFGLFLQRNAVYVEAFTKTILVAVTALVSYKTAVQLAEAWTKRKTAATLLATIADKANVVVLRIQMATVSLAQAAYRLLTFNIGGATNAMKAFNTVTRLNPLGFVIGLITAAATAYIAFSDSTDDAAQAQSDLNDQLERFKELQSATETIEQRATQITRMNKAQLQSFIDDTQQQLDNLANAELDIRGQVEKRYESWLQGLQQQAAAGSSVAKQQISQLTNLIEQQIQLELQQTTAFDEATRQRLAIALAAAKARLSTFRDLSSGKGDEADRLKALKELTDKVDEYSDNLKTSLLDETDRQVKAVTDRYEQLIQQAKQYAQTKDAFDQAFHNREVELIQLRDEEIRRIEEAAHNKKLQELEKQKQDFLKKQDEVFERYFGRSNDQKMQRELAELNKNAKLYNFTTEQYERAAADIRKKYADEEIKIEQEKWQQLSRLVDTYADHTMQVMSTINDVSEYFKNLELQRLDEVHDRQTRHNESISQQIEDQYARRQMSEEQYLNAKYAAETEQTRIETEQTEQRKKIEKKYAAFKLVETLASIYMDTSKAIMASVAASPLTGGLPWSAVVGTMGTVQAGIAIAQYATMQGAEDGGLLVRRKQDGKMFKARTSERNGGYFDSPTVLVGERGNEYVAPHEALQNPTIAPILGIIEKARQTGTLRTLNMPRAIAATGYASGGYTVRTTAANNTAIPTPVVDTDLLYRVLNKLENLEARVVYTQFKEVEDNVAEITNKAKITK